MSRQYGRAVSPVVAVILMVAVTVILSAVIGTFVLNLGQSATSGAQSNVGVSIDRSSPGNVTITVVTGSADSLQVLVNGSAAADISNPSAGDSVSVSLNESADVTVVSVTDGEKTVVTSTTFDSTTSTVSSTNQPFASDSLVALWSYDSNSTASTLVDEWSGYNGTIYSAPAYVSGHDNLSLDFDGTDDYVTVSVPINQSFTYAIWAKSDTTTWNESGVIGSARDKNGFIMHPDGGMKKWGAYVIDDTTTGWTRVGSHTPSDITVWHQYALTYNHDTGEAAMYFDGVKVNSTTLSIARNSDTISVVIGKDEGYTRYHDGQLDDTRLYDRALNSSEMQTLYNETK